MVSQGTERNNKIPTSVYIASNISTEKMLDALSRMRDTAHANHAAKVAAEQARYEQELKDIEHFRDGCLYSKVPFRWSQHSASVLQRIQMRKI